MLIDKISSSNTDSTMIESDLGKETTNYTCPVENNGMSLDNVCANNAGTVFSCNFCNHRE